MTNFYEDLQVCISTMNSTYDDFKDLIKKIPNILIINQCPNQLDGSIKKKYFDNGIWIDYDEIGLSKSRNLALKEATSKYIYLTDDDIDISDNFYNHLQEILTKNDYDFYAFIVEGKNRKFKNDKPYSYEINKLDSIKFSSVQLIFKRKFLIDNSIFFDENFGTGAFYRMGEENILLIDVLKKGAKGKYFPIKIANVYLGESSWFKGFNQKYFFDRGATYFRMFGYNSYLLCVLFCISKRNKYKDNISIISAISSSFQGIQYFRKTISQNNQFD
ncbi:TPA: glycosyltransferase [Streptococcus suis]